jgi:predicted nucleic acid-binding protein
MAEALRDADVIIQFLRGDKATAEPIKKSQLQGLPGYSVITRFEIKAGMRPSEQRATEACLDSLTDYPVTAEITDQAVEYFRALLARGKTADLPDLIVAAAATAHRLVVVTHNAEHFSVPDLTLYPLSAPTGKPRTS